jgi:flagellar secretion chaperone FliS
MPTSTVAEQYKKISAHAGIEDANAHKLIQMLLAGALEKINFAKSCIARDDVAGKGENISFAISIIDGLQASLDKEKGGEIADNLFRLYHYMMEKLIIANFNSDIDLLDEIANLLISIKSAWDGIEQEANQILDKDGNS